MRNAARGGKKNPQESDIMELYLKITENGQDDTQLNLTDTTLRDGEQSPDIAFSSHIRLKIAELLFRTGFEIVEAGIPAMGSDEKDMILKIGQTKGNKKVAVWNRMNKKILRTHSIVCRILFTSAHPPRI